MVKRFSSSRSRWGCFQYVLVGRRCFGGVEQLRTAWVSGSRDGEGGSSEHQRSAVLRPDFHKGVCDALEYQM